MKIATALLSLCAATAAIAQTGPTEFPAGATVLTAAALQDLVVGKVYSVKLPNGVSWRMEYKAGGAYFFKSSRGLDTSGKWSIQEGKVCTEGEKLAPSCNEVRKLGDALLLKRDNGEIVTMTVQ